MATLDTALVAHMEVNGERFEIFVDPDLGLAYKQGSKKELNNVLVAEEIYKNARKGERCKSSELQKAFHTDEVWKIADMILKKGELALTTDQKRKMLEEKRKQIASLIAREAIDPRTGAPHTLTRITQAMENVRLDIDPFKDASMQVDATVSALRLSLPIKFEKKRIAVKIGPEHAQKTYGLLKNYGIQKEEWTTDGSIVAVIELPAGIVSEFFDRLNKATSGQAQTKMV